MWRYELKKILIKRKGLLIIAAVLFLEFFSISQQYSFRINSDIEHNKELYMAYMEEYGGVADEVRYNKLNETINKLESDIENANSLLDRYMAGEITREEMYELRTSDVLQYVDLDVLKCIRTQYEYALQNDEAGIVMYETGWIILLGSQHIRIIIPIILVIMLMVLYTENYEYEMYRITDCCKRGKNKLLFHKLAASVITATIVCSAIMLFDYILVALKYGLDNPMENIMSIQALKDAPIHAPLVINYLLTGISLMAGSVIVIAIIAFVGQILKNQFYGIISVITFLILPYVLWEREEWVEYMLPLSFFTDGGYVNGFEVLQDERLATGSDHMIKLMVCFVTIICLLVGVAMFVNRKKKNTMLLLVMVMCISMSGCESYTPDKDMFIDGTEHICIGEVGDVVISDAEGQYSIYIKDKKLPLHDSPFSVGSGNNATNVTAYKNKVYYQVDEKKNGIDTMKIYELDTDTLERKMILKKSRNAYMEHGYLDLNKKLAVVGDGNIGFYSLIMASDDFVLYYCNADIVMYNRTTGSEKTILSYVSNFSVYNGDLYYTDRNTNIMKYDFADESSTMVLQELVTNYHIYDKKIYYLDTRNLNVKQYDMESGSIETLVECEVDKFTICDDKIFYKSDRKLCIYDIKTGETTIVADSIWYFYVLKEHKIIVYMNADGEYVTYDLE